MVNKFTYVDPQVTAQDPNAISNLQNHGAEQISNVGLPVVNIVIPISITPQTTNLTIYQHLQVPDFECASANLESLGHEDIMKLLTMISTQMTSSYQGLQDRIQQNDLQLSKEFQRAIDDNDNFKKDVCEE
jgi:hypothetical protein